MENLISWVKGIVCYSILTAVFTEILPSKFHKYLKLYMGLLFILLFLSPAVQLFHLEDRMEEFFSKANLQMELEDRSFELQLQQQNAYQTLKEEYTLQLNGKLEGFLSARGYELAEAEIVWNENTKEQTFGEVSELRLTVIPKESVSEGIRVDKVRVEVFQEQEETMEEKALKNELVNFYNIGESNIHVTIQGGKG